MYDSAERNDRNIGRAATHIDNHTSARLGYIDSHADCRRKGFFYKMHPSCSCLGCRIDNGAFLNLGYTARNAYNHSRLKKVCHRRAFCRFLYKIFEHTLCYGIIGNYTLAQRTYREDSVRSPSEHILCLSADRKQLCAFAVNRNNRRLFCNYAPAVYIYHNCGCSQINTYILSKHFFLLVYYSYVTLMLQKYYK